MEPHTLGWTNVRTVPCRRAGGAWPSFGHAAHASGRTQMAAHTAAAAELSTRKLKWRVAFESCPHTAAQTATRDLNVVSAPSTPRFPRSSFDWREMPVASVGGVRSALVDGGGRNIEEGGTTALASWKPAMRRYAFCREATHGKLLTPRGIHRSAGRMPPSSRPKLMLPSGAQPSAHGGLVKTAEHAPTRVGDGGRTRHKQHCW